ncbi:GntR family transcriptional regulator [Streptomyces sp. NPDC096033]|uniref:GntR family transcriptional regulator n=1 Tax=Streptomyces sp. NPDC096033 TaxID=3366071 RepID=UPI00381334A9
MPSDDASKATASTAERAYAHVSERILTGEYAGGQMLSEGAVAAELGLSRTPVREAFLRLQVEGYLTLYPKRGAVVVPTGPNEARSVIEARLLLELHALDTLAAHGPAALTELARNLLTHTTGPTAPAEVVAAAQAFHTDLVAAAGNPVITGMYENLWNQQRRVFAAAIQGPGSVVDDIAEHTAIAEAMGRGHVTEARKLLERHIVGALPRIGHADVALPPTATRSK